MDESINKELLTFIEKSPTAWHAVKNLAERLREEGYTELHEEEDWALVPGARCFVRRNGSSLLAFRIPREMPVGFMLMAAHADSPCLRLKELATAEAAGLYARVPVERYGGMILSTWLDRPLSVAGRLVVREGERLTERLVDLARDVALIPNVAIHMDRSVNDGKAFDLKTDMLPLIGSENSAESFRRLIADAAGTREEDICSAELQFYPRTPGTIWGAEGEYVSAPRLDDLQCVFACAQGFLAASESGSVPVFCCFDNEEVGSSTRQGAAADFLSRTLARIAAGLGCELPRLLAQSFLVSADNAHAVHPNHPEYADAVDRPAMNRGIVLKFNASQRYVTDAVSAAVFREICRRADVPVQRYTNRADLPGGSTLGNISLAQVAVRSLDIGLAQLAMHSSYETAGARDTAWLCRAARRFFESSLHVAGETITIRDGGRNEV